MKLEEDRDITLSVVIPFFNEEGSLNELHKRICEAVKDIGLCEFIFIDDGSTDSSNSIIKKLKETDSRIRLLTFRRNQGKSSALSLGFKVARAELPAQPVPEKHPDWMPVLRMVADSQK